MAVLGSLIVIFAGMMVVTALVAGIFIWIGARMAGIANAGFGRCILVAIGCSFATWFAALAASILPVLGTISGFVFGLFLSLLVIKMMFAVSFGKAFLVWIFHVIAQCAAIFIGLATFAGALAGSMSLLR